MAAYRFPRRTMTPRVLVTVCVGIVFCLCGILLWGIAAENVETHAGESLEAILTQADAYSREVHSGRFLFRTEAEFPNQEAQDFVEETEVWFDGVRSRVEQTKHYQDQQAIAEDLTDKALTVFDGEKVTQTGLHSFDAARVTPVADLTQLRRLIGGVRSPFCYYAIGPAFNCSLPLGALIRAWGGRLAGTKEVNGEVCYHLTAGPQPGSGWQITRSWWLSPTKGYAAVRYVEEVIWETGETARKRMEHTVEQWSEVQSGVWLPRVVVKNIYMQKRGELESLEGVQTTTMLAGDPNAKLSDDLFQLELPETTHVMYEQ